MLPRSPHGAQSDGRRETAITVTSRTNAGPHNPLDANDPDPMGYLGAARERCLTSQPRPNIQVLVRHQDLTSLLRRPELYSLEVNVVLDRRMRTVSLPTTPVTMMTYPTTAIISPLIARRSSADVRTGLQQRSRWINDDVAPPIPVAG